MNKYIRGEVEFINVDGSVAGTARIKWVSQGRDWQLALRHTIGVGYEIEAILPVTPIGDPRCPYRIRFKLVESGAVDA